MRKSDLIIEGLSKVNESGSIYGVTGLNIYSTLSKSDCSKISKNIERVISKRLAGESLFEDVFISCKKVKELWYNNSTGLTCTIKLTLYFKPDSFKYVDDKLITPLYRIFHDLGARNPDISTSFSRPKKPTKEENFVMVDGSVTFSGVGGKMDDEEEQPTGVHYSPTLMGIYQNMRREGLL